MGEWRSKDRILDNVQGYHSTRGEFGLADVAFKEGHPFVSRIESVGR